MGIYKYDTVSNRGKHMSWKCFSKYASRWKQGRSGAPMQSV